MMIIVSIDGPTSLTMSDNTLERFNALGWHTTSIDGYHLKEVDSALTNTKRPQAFFDFLSNIN